MPTTRRTARRLLVVGVALALSWVGGAAETATAAPAASVPTTAVGHAGHAAQPSSARRAAKHKKKHRRKKHAPARAALPQKPQNFSRQTVRAVRGLNKITVTWPARLRATGYTVTWAPSYANLPTSPATCVYPCQHRFTRGTSMVLTSADLSTRGRTISSASGNTVRFKLFAHNGTLLNWTGLTYPFDAWVAPAATATTDWLPAINAQLPLPLPPATGRDVAITSFNLLSASATGVPTWTTRAPLIAQQINATGSSIVATQEDSNSSVGVNDGTKSQFQSLADRLAPSGWALADSRNWDYTLGATRSASSQATRIFYRTADWSQAENGAFLTHADVDGQTSGVNVDRWVSWSRFQSTADPATQLCVLSVHLLTNLGSYDVASADHRNAEVAQIVSELDNPSSTVTRVGTRVGEACAGVPTVVAGDFNAAEGHAPYGNQPQASLISAGFVDTTNAATRVNTRWTGPGTVTAWHETFGSQIDYIMAKGVGGARSFKVNAAPPSDTGSDHYPVTAVVSVPQQP